MAKHRRITGLVIVALPAVVTVRWYSPSTEHPTTDVNKLSTEDFGGQSLVYSTKP
jgi:hypothetical protein